MTRHPDPTWTTLWGTTTDPSRVIPGDRRGSYWSHFLGVHRQKLTTRRPAGQRNNLSEEKQLEQRGGDNFNGVGVFGDLQNVPPRRPVATLGSGAT